MPTPRGLLFDYGGTLVEEVSVDLRAGNDWLFSRASYRPPHVTLDDVLERARRVAVDVAGRRDETHLETAWPALSRLIHDYFGIRFDAPMSELAMGFWKASVRTREMPGARAALEQCHRAGLRLGVVSNTSFSEEVIRHELATYGLEEHLSFVMVSSDYAVRKPNVLLYEVAAARLGIPAEAIWFVGDRLDTDIAGAKAAGMTAIWFNRDEGRAPSTDVDVTIDDWARFAERVIEASAVS